MKLSIKKKYFDKIKSGDKTLEFRAAHITFVCEETGEILTKPIKNIKLSAHIDFTHFGISKEEAAEMFASNEKIIVFEI